MTTHVDADPTSLGRLARFPAQLIERPQFVLWRREAGNKIPINARFGYRASHSRPSDWTTWHDALDALARSATVAGVSRAFAVDDFCTGIDLDDSLEAGQLLQWARPIVERFPTYWEVSPSGNGLKGWVGGRLDADSKERGGKKRGGVEVYDRLRFFTVTGKHFAGLPLRVVNHQAELLKFYDEHFPPDPPLPRAAPRHYQRDAGDVVKRCLSYVLKCGDSVSGSRGHDNFYRAARECNRFALSESQMWDVLRDFNATKCSPPWSDREMAHKIAQAMKYGAGERGVRLREERPARPTVAVVNRPRGTWGPR